MPEQDQTRSPVLLIIMLVIIILTIVAFLVLHPRGSDADNRTNPAAPAESRLERPA